MKPSVFVHLLLFTGLLGASGLPAQENAGAASSEPDEIEPVLVLAGHDADVYDVAFAPDGRTLATASFDRMVRVWDAETGELRIFLAGHDGKVLSVDYSPDARLLASGSDDRSVKLWDVPGDPARDFSGRTGRVLALAISRDLEWLASADAEGTVLVHQRGNQSLRARLDAGGAMVRALDFAPQTNRLAAVAANRLLLWDLASVLRPAAEESARAEVALLGQSAEWRYFKGVSEPPAAWKDPDHDAAEWPAGRGGFGYSSAEAELASVATRLDDMADGSYVSLYLRASFSIDAPAEVERLSLAVVLDDGCVAYLNGSEVARVNLEGTPPAFDATAARTREPERSLIDLGAHRELLRPGRNVLAIQAHNTSRSSSDFVISVELVAALARTPREDVAVEARTLPLPESDGELTALAWNGDGSQLVTGSKVGGLLVWTQDGEAERRIEHGWPVHDLVFVADGRIAVTGGGNNVTLWNTLDGSPAGQLQGHVAHVQALGVSASGTRLVSGSVDGRVIVWDLEKRQPAVEVPAHERPVRDLALSPDGEQFVSTGGDDGEVKVWTAAGKELRRHAAPGPITCLAIANRDRVYAAGWNAAIREWRTATSTALKTLAGHEGAVHAVAFSPTGRVLASGSADASVRLWNVVDGAQLRALPAHAGAVYALTFHPDGHLLASGGFDRAVKLWDPASGAALSTLNGHGEGVFALAFAPDGERLYSGSSDRTVRRWNVASGVEEAVFAGHPGWVCGVVLTGGGRTLASIDYGGNVFWWDAASGQNTRRGRFYTVVYGLAGSPDGKRLATASMGRSVLVFAAEEGS